MEITCPVGACRTTNDAAAEVCERCGIPLAGYAHLTTHPARLFNQGLSAAREGNVRRARDLFSAVVQWCPHDLEARNALALACYMMGDREEAGRQWKVVLENSSQDATAAQGLVLLQKAGTQKQASRRKRRSASGRGKRSKRRR